MTKLTEIQTEMKAPKSRYNKFGGYNYRSLEDILEAVKPLLKKYDASLRIWDEVEAVGSRVYVVAHARFTAGDETAEVKAYAREAETKKGMDDSQITGTASSYARKYALNGLFLIDDTKDADTDEYHEQVEAVKAATISKQKAASLLAYIQNNFSEPGSCLEWIGKNYSVGKVEDLTEEQYTQIFNLLRKKAESSGNGRKG